MAVQNRVFWAVEAIGMAPLGSLSFTAIHGAQSVGINTNFQVTSVLEIGQSADYEQVEGVPDIEVTIEKVLDGYPLVYHRATPQATSPTLLGRMAAPACMMALPIFDNSSDSASGTPLAEVQVSGLLVSSLNYNIQIEGPVTESVTLVANNKTWKNSAQAAFTGQIFDNTDQPQALNAVSGGVQFRENVIFYGQSNITLLPTQIPGISTSGTNNRSSDGNFPVHVQRIGISVDVGREPIYELGRKGPYFRFANLPAEVTTEIEIMSLSGDWISATEAGNPALTGVNTGNNLVNESIKVVMQEGTIFDMGTRNKLRSIALSGADTGGSNQTVVYTYANNNFLTITHPFDPAGL